MERMRYSRQCVIHVTNPRLAPGGGRRGGGGRGRSHVTMIGAYFQWNLDNLLKNECDRI